METHEILLAVLMIVDVFVGGGWLLLFIYNKWRERQIFCHHPNKVLALRHLRLTPCKEGEDWHTMALEILGDLHRAYPHLTQRIKGFEKGLKLHIAPIVDIPSPVMGTGAPKGAYLQDEGVIRFDPPNYWGRVSPWGRGEGKATIAHELWHALKAALGSLCAKKYTLTQELVQHYLLHPWELEALVFATNYSKADASLLREIRGATKKEGRS